MKRINVSGDIESRRRIAERHIPSTAQPTIYPEQDESGQEKKNGTDKDSAADGAPKARRRKAEGNP